MDSIRNLTKKLSGSMDEEQNENNLYKGKCSECGTWSTALVKDDGRCIPCIEDEKFYEYQRKINNNEIRD